MDHLVTQMQSVNLKAKKRVRFADSAVILEKKRRVSKEHAERLYRLFGTDSDDSDVEEVRELPSSPIFIIDDKEPTVDDINSELGSLSITT